jgi:hypothetical protein
MRKNKYYVFFFYKLHIGGYRGQFSLYKGIQATCRFWQITHFTFSLFPKERSETVPELCDIEQAWAGGHNKEVHKLEVQ